MNNIFHTQGNNIIIHRKPSEMPFSIDLDISRMGCSVSMDGPNKTLTYQYLNEKDFQRAKDYLIKCGWKEET